MQQQTPYLVGIGAANVDLHGRSRKAIVLHDSNPGYLHTSAGGVTRNILENCARQGVPAALMSAVGADLSGQVILSACKVAGIDVSRVLIRENTVSSTYMAMLDENGEVFAGMSDMRILESLPETYLEENARYLRAAAAIVTDGCLQLPFLERLLSVAEGHVPVFVDPVSTAYARKIAPIVGGFYAVKPNRLELAVLSGTPVETDAQIELAAEHVLSRGTRRVVVSLGARGCYYADDAGRRVFRSLRPVDDMENATGAGDAFMAGFLHGHLLGLSVEEQLDYALASGIVAVRSPDTIHPGMSDSLVRETLERSRI